MITLTRRFSLPALAATLLLGTAGALSAAGGIQDDGAFFSEFAKTNASGTIQEVATKLRKDIAVQTFAAVPEDMKAAVLQASKSATNRGFSQWAEQLARSKGVNGVFILLVKQPAHLQVVVGNDTQRQAFTLMDREKLVQIMIQQLRDKKSDDALIDGVNFISTTMHSHRSGGAVQAGGKSHAAQQGGSSWLSTILIVMVIFVGFNLIRSLFRAMSGGGSSAGGVGQPYGGGFFQNMMGSMFGAAAGMWMYDQFFGSHSSAANLGDHHTDMNPNDGGGFSGTDTDYSSSGGSFGDDSGGFGGGDSGGGDFGGGGDF
ncbi:MAG: hypothetical protein J0L73_11050 [Verrucomicrobia bacterium]|nr:hypothetical protein [Verrucomicrobiota bacterium]